MMRLPGYLEAD